MSADQRADAIADLRAFADFLARNSWAPLPSQTMQADLQQDGVDVFNGGAEGVAELRRIADALGEEPNERANDRTTVTRCFGSIRYRVIAWHAAGRPVERDPRDVELERLRAEVAELRSAQATTKSLVADETPEHYEKRGWVGEGPGSCGVECACGLGYDGFDSLAEASKMLEVHIEASVDPEAGEPAQPRSSARFQVLLWKRDVTQHGDEVAALEHAHGVALFEDGQRAKAAVIADLRPGEHGRVMNPNLAQFLAGKEHGRREATRSLGCPRCPEPSAAGDPAADAVARQIVGQGPGGPS